MNKIEDKLNKRQPTECHSCQLAVWTIIFRGNYAGIEDISASLDGWRDIFELSKHGNEHTMKILEVLKQDREMWHLSSSVSPFNIWMIYFKDKETDYILMYIQTILISVQSNIFVLSCIYFSRFYEILIIQ